MVTRTSPDDPAAAEGPEAISGQRLCLKGNPPKISRGCWSPLKTSWGSGCDWWELSEGLGSAGTVLVLELVGGYEGVPHTVRIKLNSYGFHFIFHKDRRYMSWCISTMASASLAGIVKAAKASPTLESRALAPSRLTRVPFPPPQVHFTPQNAGAQTVPQRPLLGSLLRRNELRLPLLPAVP